MRQRIEVNARVPGSGYKLKIMAVHQVDDQLIVVSKIKGGYGLETPDQQTISDAVVVAADSGSKLPVFHFLLDANKKQTGHHFNEYLSQAPANNATVYEPIDDEAALTEITANGKCLYRPRPDGMSGLRLARNNKEVKPILQLVSESPGDISIKSGETPGILNIHSVVDDGAVKVVFETILPKSKHDRAFNLKYLFQHALEKIGKNTISLENDLLMSMDDDLHFDVQVGGVKTKYITGAYEFTIPANNPQLLLDFMLVVDFMIAEARKQSAQSYGDSYQFIQVSQQSVLTCFEDIFISTHRDLQSHIKKHCIEYPEPIVLEDFLNRLGTVHNPASVADMILTDIANNQNMPEYADLQQFLVNYYQKLGLDIFKNPAKFFEQAYNLPVSRLFGDAAIEEKLAITDALEMILMDSKKLSELSYFVKEFNAGAIEELLRPAYGYRAHNGKPYQESYTEFAFLRDAKFRIRDDGRMSIQPHESNAYDRFYGENEALHSLFAQEMMHLANILELEIADDTEFEEEIIFTEESTSKLKALGLHINEYNLRAQIANRAQDYSAGSVFAFFRAKQVTDEDQDKPSRVCSCLPDWCTVL